MKSVDRTKRRIWKGLIWRDPRTDLVELGKLQGRLTKEGRSPAVDDLRNHRFKQFIEQRQAALFAHLISQAVLKAPIAYAMHETEDYDCVLWWKNEQHSYYIPVQLKEIVPPHINPNVSIDVELSKLEKYVGTSETVAAVHLNQSGQLDFAEIKAPKTGLSEIWLYSSITPDQSEWFLYGNILDKPKGYQVKWST